MKLGMTTGVQLNFLCCNEFQTNYAFLHCLDPVFPQLYWFILFDGKDPANLTMLLGLDSIVILAASLDDDSSEPDSQQ